MSGCDYLLDSHAEKKKHGKKYKLKCSQLPLKCSYVWPHTPHISVRSYIHFILNHNGLGVLKSIMSFLYC